MVNLPHGVAILLAGCGGDVIVEGTPSPGPFTPTCRVISIAHQAPFPQSGFLPESAITGNEPPVSRLTLSLAATVCDSSHTAVY